MQEIQWYDVPSTYPQDQARMDAARARAQKRYAAALKPVCSRCGKPGSDCRKREACNARRLKRSLLGCDALRLHGVATLPLPPTAWKVARGYVGRNDWRGVGENLGMRQHYAYDLAMNVSWDDEADLAA